jgi:hypothetical protein
VKVECPVCGVEGFLEVRGNSQRVLHYKSFVNGRRVYERHPLGINGNQTMGINKPDSVFLTQNMEPRAGFGPATATLPR